MGSDSKWHKRSVVIGLALALSCCILLSGFFLYQKMSNRASGKAEQRTERSHSSKTVNGMVAEVEIADSEKLNKEVSVDTDGGYVSTWLQEGTVEEVAKYQLVSYKNAENCILVRSEYLDLFGNSWVCLVQGPTWVESCFVTAKGSKDSQAMSEIKLIHMDVAKWREDAENTFNEAG